MAIEHFERGMMLWVRQFARDVMSDGSILVITPDSNAQTLIRQEFPDLWREGQPTGLVGTPPEGRYAPRTSNR
jgi:hypothetical protein